MSLLNNQPLETRDVPVSTFFNTPGTREYLCGEADFDAPDDDDDDDDDDEGADGGCEECGLPLDECHCDPYDEDEDDDDEDEDEEND